MEGLFKPVDGFQFIKKCEYFAKLGKSSMISTEVWNKSEDICCATQRRKRY